MNKKTHNLKKAFFLFLFLVIAAGVEAQTHEFAPVGAEWYYERYYREGFDLTGITYDRFRSLRTIEISGWECKEIELFQNLDCHGEVNPYTEIRYITQEGDQVYEVEDGQRFLLYDFGKEVGEWWYAPKYNDTIYVYGVDSIQLLNGCYRKRLHLWPTTNNLYYTHLIDGIGLDLSIFPFEMPIGSPCVHSNIRCYSENGTPLIVSETECEYEVLTVDEHDESLIVSMNSFVENSLHMEFQEMLENIKRVKIIDLLGRSICTTETIDNSLDIDFSNKPTGVYLVQTVIGLQVINNKIVKR